MRNRTVVLVILDGWGIGKDDFTNPIHLANLPNINYLKQNFPSGSLQASGIAVGLPWGEEGNSEVGHLNMGAGKIIYQSYPQITMAIRSEEFFTNKIVKKAFNHAKENNSSVNLIGLLTDANVHASFEHLEALIKFAEKENFPKEKVNLHLITDGRDSPPKSAIDLINRLSHIEQLASLSGRFYAMDRDKHWDRTKEAYMAITGQGPSAGSGQEKITDDFAAHIKAVYEKNLNDEYIVPTLIGPVSRPIKENDSVIFFNFREDRMKQIVMSFIQKDFKNFPVINFSNLYIATMTKYDDTFNLDVISPPEKIEMCLSKALSDSGKTQWRIAETEKYAHVTYFFNGEKETPFKGEFRVLIPSQTGFKYDDHPEMRAEEISQRLIEAIEEKSYDFIMANFANGDIMAHTGNFEATTKAVELIDSELGKITKAVLDSDSILIITSDHGNAERLKNPATGESETKHDVSPVPIYLVGNEFKRERSAVEIKNNEKQSIGVLADVAPTILELMGIKKPVEMTAQSLVSYLLD